MLFQIQKSDSKKLKSQQYFPNIYSILKELVENSLDANSTTIKIMLDDKIIVEDNGDGVESLEIFGKQRCTSKIKETYKAIGYVDDSLEDMAVFSYGFRGQALYSLKDLATITVLTNNGRDLSSDAQDISKVCTREPREANSNKSRLAWFKDLNANVINRSFREKGTTVTVSKIFEKIPVRKNLLNFKKEIPKILYLLKSYIILHKVSINLFFEGKLIFSEIGCGNPTYYMRKSYLQNNLYEKETQFFHLIISDDPGKDCFMFYQKRLILNTNIKKAVQDTYSLFRKGKALFFIQLKGSYDFNISPDKTEILIHNLNEVICNIRASISELFSQTYTVVTKAHKQISKISLENTSEKEKYLNVKKSAFGIENYVDQERLQNHSYSINFINSCHMQESLCSSKKLKEDDDNTSGCIKEANTTILGKEIQMFNGELNVLRSPASDIKKPLVNRMLFAKKIYPLKIDTLHNFSDKCTSKKLDQQIYEENSSVQKKVRYEIISRDFEEKLESRSLEEKTINANIENQETLRDFVGYSKNNILEHLDSLKYFGIYQASPLKVKVQKEDFLTMNIIGQFNNGFILCRLPKDGRNAIVIIDQHASDEIKNFEWLQKNQRLKTQTLINPIPLDLNSMDRFILNQNIDIFERNGFIIAKESLLTVPVCEGIVFTIKDFYDLLCNVKNGCTNLEKIKQIFANKACRMSIMIGQPLSQRKMCELVRSLASLNVPWCCPHGRPILQVLDVF